jgi:murein DD-endopeptidase MepM/ murein hydrolase activator NlpD/uncharacterized protein YdaT
MRIIKKLGGVAISYLVSMFVVGILAILPFLFLTGLTLFALDSMKTTTGENYNLSGSPDFDIELGKKIVGEYKEKAKEWMKGLSNEEIQQVVSNGLEMQYSVMLALDKIRYNFSDLDKYQRYMNETYELLKPEYFFRDSEIRIKKESVVWDEKLQDFKTVVTEEVKTTRLLDKAVTYQGEFRFFYKMITDYNELQTEGGIERIWTTYETLRETKPDYSYEKLKNALARLGWDDDSNVDLVIFQAYSFDPNVKDPKIENLLPDNLLKVRPRGFYGKNTDLPKDEHGETDYLSPLLKNKVPDNYIATKTVKIQLYGQSYRIDKGRTELGTTPRRGTNGRFGTIAVAKNNPYGLQIGMKVYIPRYGYAVVEEYNGNVDDPGMNDRKSFWDNVISFLYWELDLADSALDSILNVTSKDEVVYLYVGASNDEYSKFEFARTANQRWKISNGFVGGNPKWYDDETIYILDSNYEIPFNVTQYEQENRVFFDGSTWPITSPYGNRIHPITKKKSFHRGTDWGVHYGVPILALNRGVILDQGKTTEEGKYVKILLDLKAREGDQLKDIVLRYVHLSDYVGSVGQAVEQGDIIAHVGNTGLFTTGAHVHMEVIVGDTNRDPTKWIPFLIRADGEIDVFGDQPYFGGEEYDDD